MRYFLTHVSIVIVLLLLNSVLLWPVIFDKIVTCPPLKCYRVCHCWIFLLIYCIKNLKSMNTNKLIITINIKTNLIFSTIFNSSFMKIGYSCSLHFIPNKSNFIRADIMFIDKSLNIMSSIIRRSIINNNNMIILIILIKYTLKIKLIPKISNIIITWNNYTKR